MLEYSTPVKPDARKADRTVRTQNGGFLMCPDETRSLRRKTKSFSRTFGITRLSGMAGVLLSAIAGGFLLALAGGPVAAGETDPVLARAQAVEARLQARVGLMIVDLGTGRRWAYHADARFPMASTVKALACAAALGRGEDLMARRVPIRKADLVPHAPVMAGRVGESVSVAELCAATLETSDNVALNRVLDSLGGPPAVTAFVRGVGDPVTRLDRREPDLNAGTPGDPRDTTTPAAMVATLEALLLGDALPPPARAQLVAWMEANAVAGPLLRSALPPGWRIADRSGAGGHGTRGIIAVIWPPAGGPVVAAIYLTETSASLAERDAGIAEIGQALVTALSGS